MSRMRVHRYPCVPLYSDMGAWYISHWQKGAKGEQERTKSDGDGGVSITRPHVKLRLISIQKFPEPSVLARLIHVAFIFAGFWETERWLIVRVRIVAGTPSRVQYRTGGKRVEKINTGPERGKSVAWRTVPWLAGHRSLNQGALCRPPSQFSTFHVRPLCHPRRTQTHVEHDNTTVKTTFSKDSNRLDLHFPRRPMVVKTARATAMFHNQK